MRKNKSFSREQKHIFSLSQKSVFFVDLSLPVSPFHILKVLIHLLAPTGALVLMMVYYMSRQRQLFQIFTQSIDAIDVTSITLSRLNSINACDVKRC